MNTLIYQTLKKYYNAFGHAGINSKSQISRNDKVSEFIIRNKTFFKTFFF